MLVIGAHQVETSMTRATGKVYVTDIIARRQEENSMLNDEQMKKVLWSKELTFSFDKPDGEAIQITGADVNPICVRWQQTHPMHRPPHLKRPAEDAEVVWLLPQ